MEDNEQLYVVVESDILKNRNISNTAKICYAYIQYFSNNKYGYCFLTRKKLAYYLNIKLRNLYYIIDILIKNNYVIIVKKNNRSYLMPTINTAIRKRDKENEIFGYKSNKNIFNYNWLNEED